MAAPPPLNNKTDLSKVFIGRVVSLLTILLGVVLLPPAALSPHASSPAPRNPADDAASAREDRETCPPGPSMLYSIILPTYNERENLPLIAQFIDDAFEDAGLRYEIVVVDDSSPDGTLEAAESLRRIFGEDRIRIVSRPGKLGLGSAYSAGLEASSGDRIVLMDADLSHHPQYIPTMIAVMDDSNGRLEIVSGTRYARGGGVAGWDAFRKLTSCGANFLATFLLSTGGASDLTGSFRLYERRAIERILPRVRSRGYAFQMEMLVRAHEEGMRVAEVPITFVDRIYGESKLGANEILMYLKGLLRLFFTT